MRITILGLSITSSWGNGHATTYRGLVRELCALGHEVLFLERDQPWYRGNRDMPEPPFGETHLYSSLSELKRRFASAVRTADCVILGSFVPDGIAVGRWVTENARGVTAFYDIDTPVTLAALERGSCEYLSADLIPQFDVYLSFTGGPTLAKLEQHYKAPAARALYCSVDPALYRPGKNHAAEQQWLLGYLGTYSEDRQPALERFLMSPASKLRQRRFVVAGPLYPETIEWPPNVHRITHIEPRKHRAFYCDQRFTLNVTRADMIRAGYAPSVRLFEAAACGTPIISDSWPGLGTLFEPGREILIVESTEDVLEILRDMPESEARRIGERGRERVLAEHTAAHRAAELESIICECRHNAAPNRAVCVTKE